MLYCKHNRIRKAQDLQLLNLFAAEAARSIFGCGVFTLTWRFPQDHAPQHKGHHELSQDLWSIPINTHVVALLVFLLSINGSMNNAYQRYTKQTW